MGEEILNKNKVAKIEQIDTLRTEVDELDGEIDELKSWMYEIRYFPKVANGTPANPANAYDIRSDSLMRVKQGDTIEIIFHSECPEGHEYRYGFYCVNTETQVGTPNPYINTTERGAISTSNTYVVTKPNSIALNVGIVEYDNVNDKQIVLRAPQYEGKIEVIIRRAVAVGEIPDMIQELTEKVEPYDMTGIEEVKGGEGDDKDDLIHPKILKGAIEAYKANRPLTINKQPVLHVEYEDDGDGFIQFKFTAFSESSDWFEYSFNIEDNHAYLNWVIGAGDNLRLQERIDSLENRIHTLEDTIETINSRIESILNS